MAIYHLEAKAISRGAGRSACAASAYMSCSRIYNDYDGVQHDYTRKQGLIWSQVFLPENAPPEWTDRETLWNAVEGTEKTKDSRLAREFVVALPRELPRADQQALVTEFVRQNFVAEGMCADVNIHDTDGHNPHAHILLTVRPLDEHGRWQYKTEKEYLCIRNGEERGFTADEFKAAQADGWEKQYPYKPKKGKKNVYLPPSEAERQGLVRANKYPKSTKYGRQNPVTERWNSEEQLVSWRAAWADVANRYLERAGEEQRIDHRSNADRGLAEKPTIHEGVSARMMEKEGKTSVRCEINRQIREDNRIIREMKALIAELSAKVRQTVPEIAAKLESLRDSLIIFHYQHSYNESLLESIREFMKKKVPLIKELQSVRKKIRQKVSERRQLTAEKKNTPLWSAAKQLKLASQITTLTEDTEELKSRKGQLMAELSCTDDSQLKKLEAKAETLTDTKKKVEEQQVSLKERQDAATREYAETLAAIAPEDLPEIQQERRNIRYGGRTALMQKLHGIYGENFSRRQYDISEQAVEAALPVREIPEQERKRIDERIAEKHREQEQERASREGQKKKRHSMEL